MIRALPLRRGLATRYLRRYAESNMHYRVRITRMNDPVLDQDSGTLTASPEEEIYRGQARIYTVSGPVQYELGDEAQFFSTSYVSIPMEDDWPDPHRDDVVEVIEAIDDPSLLGRKFKVTDVESGGQLAARRRMSVVGLQESHSWRPT